MSAMLFVLLASLPTFAAAVAARKEVFQVGAVAVAYWVLIAADAFIFHFRFIKDFVYGRGVKASSKC
jgi:hypothetical protein